MSKSFWIVEAVDPWSALRVSGERLRDDASPEGSAGFLPAFVSKEQAEAFAEGPGWSVAELRVVDRVDGGDG